MTARDWIAAKLLAKTSYTTSKLGDAGLNIRRRHQPDGIVYCASAGQDGFSAKDVDDAVRAMPNLRFVAVVPTNRIQHDAYQRGEELGICVAGFGELQSALEDDADIGRHVDTQEAWERRRLSRHREVDSLKRRGHHAYELRLKGERTITIVTTNSYEFTVDEYYRLLDSYDEVQPDAVVVTNPNCAGLSKDSRTAAEQAGIPLALLNDFLDGLGKR
jgi:hypothetical protein